MSPLRRRSARLASTTTPNKVRSLPEWPPARRSRWEHVTDLPQAKSSPELSSVTEGDEFPQLPSIDAVATTPRRGPTTPISSAIKPPHDEMHPSHAHVSHAPPSSAMRLGFADIQSNPQRGQDQTPTKVSGLPASPFTFQLSTNAQRMMLEMREQAAQIKAEMVAQREADRAAGEVSERVFARPKGMSGRFSAAHLAEFKKMDSIEGHASAWRAQNFTPVTSGTLKRSSSKANLDGTPTSALPSLKRSSSKANLDSEPAPATPSLKRSPSKASLNETPNSRPEATLKHSESAAKLKRATGVARLKHTSSTASLKQSPSVASLDKVQGSHLLKKPQPVASASKPGVSAGPPQFAPAKRLKLRQEDDISNARPDSRDGSFLPRPKSSGNDLAGLPHSQSSFGRLTSPTKAFLAHTAQQGKPTVSLVTSPSRSNVIGLTKSASMQSLTSPTRAAELKRRIISPGRFEKVKSILRGSKASGDDKTAIPGPLMGMSQTPAPQRVSTMDKALPPVPLTTPRRKLTKHVAFTPEVSYSPVGQGTPSPKRSILKTRAPRILEDVQYPTLDSVLVETKRDDVLYPDLSAFQNLAEENGQKTQAATKTKPGTFSFRSDHTIRFGDASPDGFGASPGQSSIRQVRGSSIMPTQGMPGSFPAPPPASTHPNKENKGPDLSAKVLFGVPHGVSNKKRARPSTDEEDAEREATERAAKKRKNDNVAEGAALFAPRIIGSTPVGSARKQPVVGTPSRTPSRIPSQTPSRTPVRTPIRTPGSASAAKKRSVLSMSRLNMLARPKARA